MHAALTDYINGVKVEDILRKHTISKTTFWRWVKKANIDLRGQKTRFTNDEIDHIQHLYNNGESIKKIAYILCSSEITISSLIQNKRTISEQVRTYSQEIRDIIIQDYINGATAKESGAPHGISESSVLRFLNDANIPRRKIEYICNEHYFDNLDSPDKFYWLGFFMADGRLGLRENASWYFECNLGMKDRCHLELFSKTIGYTGPIKTVHVNHTKRNRTYIHANLRITRVHLVKTLLHHGLKSVQNGDFGPLTNLSDEELRLLLLGYFDGDGSIYLVKPKNDQLWWRWYICGPHKEPLEYLMSRCPIVDRYNAVWAGTEWRVEYGGNIIVPRICKWLYHNASINLVRKKHLADLSIAEIK